MSTDQNSHKKELRHSKTDKYKSRVGFIMFLIFVVIYGGFILLNVTQPKLMRMDIGNLNLAIVYGFGIILVAILMAVIYNGLCLRAEAKEEKEDQKDDEEGVQP